MIIYCVLYDLFVRIVNKHAPYGGDCLDYYLHVYVVRLLHIIRQIMALVNHAILVYQRDGHLFKVVIPDVI